MPLDDIEMIRETEESARKWKEEAVLEAKLNSAAAESAGRAAIEAARRQARDELHTLGVRADDKAKADAIQLAASTENKKAVSGQGREQAGSGSGIDRGEDREGLNVHRQNEKAAAFCHPVRAGGNLTCIDAPWLRRNIRAGVRGSRASVKTGLAPDSGELLRYKTDHASLLRAIGLLDLYAPIKKKFLSSRPEVELTKLLDESSLPANLELAERLNSSADEIRRIAVDETGRAHSSSRCDLGKPWIRPLILPALRYALS